MEKTGIDGIQISLKILCVTGKPGQYQGVDFTKVGSA